jgi:hypothetical protein
MAITQSANCKPAPTPGHCTHLRNPFHHSDRPRDVVGLYNRTETRSATIEPGWRALYVNGPIPSGLTGMVAGITSAVLPVFVISTFDSDLLFVRRGPDFS